MSGPHDHPEYDAPERVARDEAMADLFEFLKRPHRRHRPAVRL